MLASTVSAIVGVCTRFSWTIILVGLALACASAAYAATHFAINTDVNKLISPQLDWRQRELEFEKLFPGHFTSTIAVVDAPTPEFAAAASSALTQRLAAEPQVFHSVEDMSGSAFFSKNALLFRPTDDVVRITQGLTKASPLIGTLVADQSLRGLTRAMSLVFIGLQNHSTTLDALAATFSLASTTIESVLVGRPAAFSWQEVMNGKPPSLEDRRRTVEIRPLLDFSALEPGQRSSAAIRNAAADLNLAAKYHAQVRLTGEVPMADQEFATVRQGALVNGAATLGVVVVILWLALRSARLIAAVFINLLVGLSVTAAVGLMLVGSLNMISVAFAVLFVGLGVDFAIQFSVRYRAERHELPELRPALAQAAAKVGVPLSLAAAAVAAGFMSFMPTDYRGVSELGEIAGVGMLIAYASSITFLPALLAVMNPPGEPYPVGYRALAPVDRFLQAYRVPVIVGTVVVAVLASPLLYFLTFDFDPIHLRNPDSEAVSTLRDLANDPQAGINSVNVVMPSLGQANAAAQRLAKLPETLSTTTLQSLVPQDQQKKLAMIQELARSLGPALQRPPLSSPPTDADNVAALNGLADQLDKAAGNTKSGGADAARRLATAARKLAAAPPAMRAEAQTVFIEPLQVDIGDLKNYLKAQPITIASLPENLRREWVAPGGQARAEVAPKGNTNKTEVLRKFARTVLAVYPDAVGGPISILKSGDTVVKAFIEAGAYALLSIAALLWLTLRRFGDVVLTLAPLLLAGLVTLELCVIIGMPLNFANIIALPVLLGLGVAFKIYYILAWRAGQANLLQSSLTRAVIWSALTTATAFGSLWLSKHPGTSSMGELLALSLACTMAAAVLFQPALMGRPRKPSPDGA